eukprot:14362-Hanusia_phi.AAC.6
MYMRGGEDAVRVGALSPPWLPAELLLKLNDGIELLFEEDLEVSFFIFCSDGREDDVEMQDKPIEDLISEV